MVHSTQLLEIHDEMWLVLSQHKWATLMWPVNAEEVSGERVQLCSLSVESSGATWFFLTDPDSIKAIPYCITWTGNGIALKITAHREHVVKNSLRKSSGFNFKQLVFIAEFYKVHDKPGRLSRIDLVKSLAKHFSDGDPMYVTEILDQENNTKKKKDELANSDLIDELLDCMDRDELRDFSTLNKDQKAKKQTDLQKKWRKIYQDKLDDAKDAGFFQFIHNYFYGHCFFLRFCMAFIL